MKVIKKLVNGRNCNYKYIQVLETQLANQHNTFLTVRIFMSVTYVK